MDFGPLAIKHHASLLLFLARSNDWRCGAELGLLSGRTFGTLLEGCPRLNLIGVDTFCWMPDAPGNEVYKDIPHQDNERFVQVIAHKHRSRSTVLKMTTHQAADRVEDGSLDFIFIDADHSYEGVKADIEDWSPKVRPDGWIMGHDFADDFPGVGRAVTEAFGEPVPLGTSRVGTSHRLRVLPCRCWAVRQ